MKTKPGLDTLSFDDLYNNLRVIKHDVKGTTASSSNTQNVAFVSVENTCSTNDISTAYSVSSPSISKSQKDGSSSYTDEVIHCFFTNKSSAPQLDYDDLKQINDDDIDELDLKCCHKIRHFAREYRAKGNQDSRRRDDIDWSGHVEEDAQNYAMMAYSSSNSGSDNKVKYCSKTCEESYARLKNLYDEQRNKLGDTSVEITSYTLALKKVEAQLLCHQQNQVAYEQKIRFMKIDLDDKTDVLAYHKKLLAEALKEKEDLKTKFENSQNSSKNISRLLNTQMSANDKFGLGYGDFRYSSILHYENEVLQSVFMNKESDLGNTFVNNRYVDEMHAVALPMTRNYMPSVPDVEISYSKFTYGLKQTSADESDYKPSEYASCEFDSSVETTTSMPEPVEIIPKVVCKPKVLTDAPIIEEYELDSDDDSVSNEQEDKEKPSFAFTDSAKHVKTSRENVKETCIPNHSPKVEKKYRNGHTRKGLGYAFTRKACFICGSFSHLIRDCDFHKKRTPKQAELTKSKNKVTGQRVNHQNKFVPPVVLTKTVNFPSNATRQNYSSQAASTSTASKVNNARPFDDPHRALKDKGIVDSGCSRHITWNKAHLANYQEFKGGFIAFGGSNGRITGKGKIKAGRLDFEDVYFMEELKHYNLVSVSQMCDKKNKVFFTDTDCLMMSPDFKFLMKIKYFLKLLDNTICIVSILRTLILLEI
nr:ribonuclease H-like domain-containing protein [Tanacetum cinerariifolium]